ncbi:hypothetical protein EV421DRAFT_2020087 [Armillaria borealis]|uniref:DUF6535 domain-containing protein n=1 Tax=Armillaria borealis TaxID=47425 RepID=A0AA39JFW2_9AGAR|nr:hypothetical protein EV421DRAFT_2020087 [Armillaria borealis]
MKRHPANRKERRLILPSTRTMEEMQMKPTRTRTRKMRSQSTRRLCTMLSRGYRIPRHPPRRIRFSGCAKWSLQRGEATTLPTTKTYSPKILCTQRRRRTPECGGHTRQSAIHDANMVEEIRDNVDVLLVFAGLFSAVVTTFVVQTSQSLQADYAQASASLLFELLLVQRAIANGSPVDTVPVSSLNPQTVFVPTATDVWVNGLWFTSLFLSLTTALYRYLGFQKWRVEVIIGVLPVLMHLALALFFIGLSLFLHPLRAALSWVVWTGTVLLIVAYVIGTILPMRFPQCPYRTPLCDLAYRPYIYVTSLVQEHYHRLHQLLQSWRKKKVQSTGEERVTRIDDSGHNRTTAKPNSLKQLELEAVEKASLRLSVEALQWLFSASSNPAVQSIVVESIGGLPMGALLEVEDVFRGSPSIVDVRRNLLSSLTELRAVDRLLFPIPSISSGMEHKFERLLRSGMFISWVEKPWSFIDVPDQLGQNEFGATLVTQIPKLCGVPNGLKWCRPGVFLHNILSFETSARFPPIVWENLIQSATDSWDPDLFNIDDQFPMLHCSAMTESSILRTDIPKQQLFASPLVVDFEQAVEYFPEVALEYMMCWLSRFDVLPGERLECRVLAAFIHLMIHRLSRLAAGTDISETPETRSLDSMLWTLSRDSLYRHWNPEPVWKILEAAIVNTPIFSQNTTDSKYDECSILVLGHYSRFVRKRNLASRIHAPSSALQLLVPFMTTQWSTLRTSRRISGMLDFLEVCLEERFRPAYDVFHQQQCLKFLATQPVSRRSAWLLNSYVTGIAAAIHPSNGDPEENQTILQAIDCLHEPGNLLFVCSTLALYTHYPVPGEPDIITALAQIRPRDPAWGNCLQRLRALADAWNENCFVGVKREPKWHQEEEEEIEEWRHNMRKAIETLEGFFSDIPLRTTASLELVQLPPPLLSLDVAEESLARATVTSVSLTAKKREARLGQENIETVHRAMKNFYGSRTHGSERACAIKPGAWTAWCPRFDIHPEMHSGVQRNIRVVHSLLQTPRRGNKETVL